MLRRMLPQENKRLTHREFVEGALGTIGESYEALKQRVVDTISREEIKQQARYGRVLTAMTEDRREQINNEQQQKGVDDVEPDGDIMDEEELSNLMVAMDSGALSSEQIMAIQRKIQRKGRCFNCGRPGHFANNCKSPNKAPGQFRKGYNPAAGKDCRICKEIGHFARDCPTAGGGAKPPGGDRGGGGGGGARPFGRPQGGGGGRPPTWKPRGGIHNTEANKRPCWALLMEEFPFAKKQDKDTTATTTTTTMATKSLSPIVSYIGHAATADPPPRTGLAACSHIPPNGGSHGETLSAARAPHQLRHVSRPMEMLKSQYPVS